MTHQGSYDSRRTGGDFADLSLRELLAYVPNVVPGPAPSRSTFHKTSEGWHETFLAAATQVRTMVESDSPERRSLRIVANFTTPPDLTVASPVIARIRLLVDGARQSESDLIIPPQGICVLVPAGRAWVDIVNGTGVDADVHIVASEHVAASQRWAQQIACAAGGGNVFPGIPSFARGVLVKPQSADVQVQYSNAGKGVSAAVPAGSDGFFIGLGDGWSGFAVANLGVIDTNVLLDWDVFR